jgi:hypothetical protein
MKKLPKTEKVPVVRTDFANEPEWQAICAAIQEPDEEFGFTANVQFISDPEYASLIAENFPDILPEDTHHTFAFIIDRATLSNPDHPVLVVDLMEEPGRSFRVIPAQMWSVENNLSIANMDFSEFADAVGHDNIYRGL